jgi:hypothetical protein
VCTICDFIQAFHMFLWRLFWLWKKRKLHVCLCCCTDNKDKHNWHVGLLWMKLFI